MKPHECQQAWINVHRLLLADLDWDYESHELVIAQLGDCMFCLKNMVQLYAHFLSGSRYMQADSRDQAIEFAQKELEQCLPI